MSDLTTPLMNYVQAVREHLQLQTELRDADNYLENALQNREKLESVNGLVDKIQGLIPEIERKSGQIHKAYDEALYAIDDGLALTVQSGCTRMAQNWLDGKKAEIRRRYSAQEAQK